MTSPLHDGNMPTTFTKRNTPARLTHERNQWSFREHDCSSSSTDTSIDGDNPPFHPKRFTASLNYLRDITNQPAIDFIRTASKRPAHSADAMGSIGASYPTVDAIDNRVTVLQKEIGKFLQNATTGTQATEYSKARDTILVELSDLRKLRKELTGHAYPSILEQEPTVAMVENLMGDEDEGEVASDEEEEVLTEKELAEIEQYMRIVKFSDDILAGKHPRIKLDPKVLEDLQKRRDASNGNEHGSSSQGPTTGQERTTQISDLELLNGKHTLVNSSSHRDSDIQRLISTLSTPVSGVVQHTPTEALSRSPSLEIVSPDGWLKKQKPRVQVELSSDISPEDAKDIRPMPPKPIFELERIFKVERKAPMTKAAPTSASAMGTMLQPQLSGSNGGGSIISGAFDITTLNGTEKQLLNDAALAEEYRSKEPGAETKRKLGNVNKQMSHIIKKLKNTRGYPKGKVEWIIRQGQARVDIPKNQSTAKASKTTVDQRLTPRAPSHSIYKSIQNRNSNTTVVNINQCQKDSPLTSNPISCKTVTNTSYAIDEDSLHDTEKQVVTLSRKIQTCENHIVSCKNSGQRVLLQNKVDRITTNLMLAVKVLKLNKGCTDERIEVLLELGRAKVRV